MEMKMTANPYFAPLLKPGIMLSVLYKELICVALDV
jgi:hypothetical protein